MSDGRMQVWGDVKTTAVQRSRVKEVTISGVHETVPSWTGKLGGGHGVKAAVREVCLHDGKIWSSHMKGPALAEEGATSNSIGYYYRRRLNRSLRNTQTVFSQQWDWHARIQT